MEKLIILGSNFFQRDLVIKAKSMGYETHVFGIGWGTPEQHKKMTAASDVADYYYPISILERDKILEIGQRIKPVGILTIGCDTAVSTISYVAAKLGLVANSEYSALVSTNKHEMRKAFAKHGVPSPMWIYTGIDFDMSKKEWCRHVIVKAVDKSGKCGITKVEDWDLNLDQLKDAIQYGIDASNEDKVLVEEFIDGKEYSAECVSYKGSHHILVFSEKYNLEPHFVEEMHLQPAPFEGTNLIPAMKKALDALEIRDACSHIEFKIDGKGNVYIIEIGARMAAECMWDVVYLSTGNDYVKMAIDLAVGKAPEIKPSTNQCALVKFLLTQADFDNFYKIKERAYRIGNIDPFDGREIARNEHRYGYYIMQCTSRQEALELTFSG